MNSFSQLPAFPWCESSIHKLRLICVRMTLVEEWRAKVACLWVHIMRHRTEIHCCIERGDLKEIQIWSVQSGTVLKTKKQLLRARSAFTLSLMIWSVATGNLWRGPMTGSDMWLHWSAPLVPHSNWLDRGTESDSEPNRGLYCPLFLHVPHDQTIHLHIYKHCSGLAKPLWDCANECWRKSHWIWNETYPTCFLGVGVRGDFNFFF